jgi:hypothetical protein
MKLDQLRKIIREEVRSAVKEELQDILNEAVKHASTPETKQTIPAPIIQQKQNNKPVSEIKTGMKSLDEMLKQTQATMTNEEYKNVFTGTSDMAQGMPNMASTMMNQMYVSAGRQPGIDISNLDFVQKAKSVLDASNKKQQLV